MNDKLMYTVITGPFLILFLLTACTTVFDPAQDLEELEAVTVMDAPLPDTSRSSSYDPGQVAQGKYLVELLGCGSCHTNGALIGAPDPDRQLAGSHTGIAYTSPLQQKNPGVVYPSNLTPDLETGLGSWRDEQIAEMIRTGTDRHGRRQIPVMPWPAYSRISAADTDAIVAYLRSLPAISHRVPENVAPGTKAIEPFVYFGVYQSRPR